MSTETNALGGSSQGLHVTGLRCQRGADFDLRADFSVPAGGRAVLVGPSGSGKSTLLRLLAGLEPLDEGRVLLDGQEITKLPVQHRGIGLVFQEQALFPALDVLENATFGLRLRGIPAAQRLALGEEWLGRLGMAKLAHASVERLSGGERQRVAFIRALIWKPRLILLDEPFSALDPALRRVLRDELAALHALCPVPLILVTHDEGDASSLATLRLELREKGSLRSVASSSSVLHDARETVKNT